MNIRLQTRKRGFRLRSKFFWALLLFSVTPLLASTFVVRSCTRDVKERLYIETRADLTNQVTRELQHVAQNFSFIMEMDSKSTIAMLGTMGIAVRHLLASPPPKNSSPLYSQDLMQEKCTLTSPQVLPLYQPLGNENGEGVPVSFDDVAFHTPSNVSWDSVRDQAQCLQSILELFQHLHQTYGDWVYRMYIGMESGLHMTYPAHCALPQEYDSRKLIWYTSAAQGNEVKWVSPVLDASTGRLLMSASLPLYNTDGILLGVAGIDILLEQGLSQHPIVSNWQDETTMMLVMRGTLKEEADRLLVVAESDAERPGVWHMGRERKFLQFEDAGYEEMLQEALADQDAGTLAMQWGGVPSFWAWSKFGKNGWFVAVTPIATVMSMPNKIIEYLSQASTSQQKILLATLLIVIIVAMLVASLISRLITRPMQLMINAVRKLSAGDFSVRITTRTGDERDMVIDALNTLGPRLEKHMETQKTLVVAHEVQENLLPTESPAVEGWDIAGASRYCDETGGDYYDFFPVYSQEGSRVAVVVGDVSGHGVPSALLMTTARALLRGQAECSRLTAAERVTRVNALLARDLYGSGRFMTLFALELEEGGEGACWVRAGHDPAIHYIPSSDEFVELEGGGLPLGVLEDTVYTGESCTLAEEGSVILIGTDGIWEAARPSDGAMFGKERVRECLREHAGRSAQEICQELLDRHAAWCAGGRRQDDVTLVVVRKIAHPEPTSA